MVPKHIWSEDISYLELWQPFCSVERNHLGNFGRGHYEEQFCEFILNLGKWFRRGHLSGALAASCSMEWNHLCNFERGHGPMGNINVKLNEIWTSGSGDVIYKKF